MNNEAIKEILNELFSHLERLETQNEAILQFLKEKKRVTDKQLAPYLEQAGNASNVRWRAARVRIDHLLSPEEPEKEVKLGKTPELHEDSSSRSEEKRAREKQSLGKQTEGKQTEAEHNTVSGSKGKNSGNQEKPAPSENKQTTPSTSKASEPEDVKSSSPSKIAEPAVDVQEQTAHAKREKRTDAAIHHPSEVSAELATQEDAEPAAQVNSSKKESGEEEAA